LKKVNYIYNLYEFNSPFQLFHCVFFLVVALCFFL